MVAAAAGAARAAGRAAEAGAEWAGLWRLGRAESVFARAAVMPRCMRLASRAVKKRAASAAREW